MMIMRRIKNLSYSFDAVKETAAAKLKGLTAVTVKKQKQVALVQSKKTDKYVSNAKTLLISNLLVNNLYVIVYRFVETPSISYAEFLKRSGLPAINVLKIGGIEHLQGFTKNFTFLSNILAADQIYIAVFNNESGYLAAIKAMISFEDDASEVMCAVFAVKEKDLWVDLQVANAGATLAREFYKKWDSTESILIELTGTLNATALGVTSLLQQELIAGAVLSIPQTDITSKS